MKFYLIALFSLWLLSGKSLAHPILQDVMRIEYEPGRLNVEVEVSVRELIVVQGLRVDDDGKVSEIEAEDLAPRHSEYLLGHLHFAADGVPLTGKVTSIKPPKKIGVGLEGPDRSHFWWSIEYALPGTASVISLRHDMVKEFPNAPGVPWDFSYAYRFSLKGSQTQKFGPLPAETTIELSTGNALPPPVKKNVMWPLLAAMALSLTGFRGESRKLHLPGLAVGALLLAAGLIIAAWQINYVASPWMLAALGGAACILTGADNLHPSFTGAGKWRRAIFLFIAFLATGLGTLFFSDRQGILPALVCCVSAHLLFGCLPILGRRILTFALIVCSMVLMLGLLNIRLPGFSP